MQISRESIRSITDPYIEQARTLIEARMDYPILSGKFIIPPTFYHNPPLVHATDIEIQLCLNQLAYAGIQEAIKREILPELRGLDFESLREENMLIIESRKRFRRPIRTGIEIHGEIKIGEFRDYEKLLIGNSEFNFEDRSCFGNLEMVIVKSKEGTQ